MKDQHMHHVISWQRVEGLAMFVFFTFTFFETGVSGWWYPSLLLVFDISMFGYLLGNKAGAFFYNLGHTSILPIVLLFAGRLVPTIPMLTALGFLWLAHIGMDRLFGYGLKLQEGFKHTHLGVIGKH
jgi:hypothetical protein